METKNEKLLRILELSGGANSTDWNVVRKLVDGIKSGAIEVADKQWACPYKKTSLTYYPLDLSDMNTWRTFDGCASLRFSNENGVCICNADIHDGDNIYGTRKGLRFTAVLKLTGDSVCIIEDKIIHKFEKYLRDAYEKHLLIQRELWIGELRESILNGL